MCRKQYFADTEGNDCRRFSVQIVFIFAEYSLRNWSGLFKSRSGDLSKDKDDRMEETAGLDRPTLFSGTTCSYAVDYCMLHVPALTTR